MGYSKLFSEIITSSIWSEDDKTRILWISMLALKDCNGYVAASIPGLANASRMTIEECEKSIAKLEAPDKYSRTPDNDGRRIVKVDGGWQVLNHEKYREKRGDDERREYQRRWAQNRRHVDSLSTDVDTCRQFVDTASTLVDNVDSNLSTHVDKSTMSTHADADADADADAEGEVVVGSEAEPPPPPAPEISIQAARIQACRPEFSKLNTMALENELRSVPEPIMVSAVTDFCADMSNALKLPDMPIKLLAGYLRKASVGQGSTQTDQPISVGGSDPARQSSSKPRRLYVSELKAQIDVLCEQRAKADMRADYDEKRRLTREIERKKREMVEV